MRKVLIVDDSKTVRREVSEALTKAGFNVVEAADGEQGYGVIKEQPDLLLAILDVNMPRLGGLDLLERLQSDPSTAKVPVLVMTTEVDPTLIQRAKRARARGWLVKPVKPALLVNAVSNLAK